MWSFTLKKIKRYFIFLWGIWQMVSNWLKVQGIISQSSMFIVHGVLAKKVFMNLGNNASTIVKPIRSESSDLSNIVHVSINSKLSEGWPFWVKYY